MREFSTRLGLLGMSEVAPIESHQDNCQDELNKVDKDNNMPDCVGEGCIGPNSTQDLKAIEG